MKMIFFQATFILLVSCAFPPQSDVAYKCKWRERINRGKSSPSPRSPEIMIWGNQRIIIFGGYFAKPNRYNTAFDVDTYADLWAFDPLTDTFEELYPTGEQPPALVGATAVWTGETMLVFGGSDYSGDKRATNNLWGYDPVKNCWHKLLPTGECPSERKDAVSVWNGSKMFVIGGLGRDFMSCNDIWTYDPQHNRWERVAQIDSTLIKHPYTIPVAVAYTHQKIFVFYCGELVGIERVLVLDLLTNKWETRIPVGRRPQPHLATAYCSYGDVLLIFGGIRGPEIGRKTSLNDLWAYHFEKNAWQELPSVGEIPEGRFTKAVWSGQELFVFGGADAKHRYFNEVWSYRPEWK